MRLLVLLFISLSAFAQHSDQPQKESTADLRHVNVLFSIEDVGEEETYILNRTQGLDHYLKKVDGSDEAIQKVDSREAKKLDADFAAKFLKCQYEISNVEGECKVTHRLYMKGETQDICKKDEKKGQEMNALIKELNQRF
jgi:hypothetical protein